MCVRILSVIATFIEMGNGCFECNEIIRKNIHIDEVV